MYQSFFRELYVVRLCFFHRCKNTLLLSQSQISCVENYSTIFNPLIAGLKNVRPWCEF